MLYDMLLCAQLVECIGALEFRKTNAGDSRALVAHIGGTPLVLQCALSVVWSRSDTEISILANDAMCKAIEALERCLGAEVGKEVVSIVRSEHELKWKVIPIFTQSRADGTLNIEVFDNIGDRADDAVLRKGASCVAVVGVSATLDKSSCSLALTLLYVHMKE